MPQPIIKTAEIRGVKLGQGVTVVQPVNVYECSIGDNCFIGPFVEIQKGVRIGRRVKVSSHTFICEGVTIEDEAFIGHGVMFINDRYPRAVDKTGKPINAADTKVIHTVIKRNASVGSGATVLCGVTVGERAMVGAGSVVTRDVAAKTVVAGNPARVLRSNR